MSIKITKEEKFVDGVSVDIRGSTREIEMRRIKAKLKNHVEAVIDVDVNFDENWIKDSMLVEGAKRQLVSKLKQAIHEKIAMLDLDDIEFST